MCNLPETFCVKGVLAHLIELAYVHLQVSRFWVESMLQLSSHFCFTKFLRGFAVYGVCGHIFKSPTRIPGLSMWKTLFQQSQLLVKYGMHKMMARKRSLLHYSYSPKMARKILFLVLLTQKFQRCDKNYTTLNKNEPFYDRLWLTVYSKAS